MLQKLTQGLRSGSEEKAGLLGSSQIGGGGYTEVNDHHVLDPEAITYDDREESQEWISAIPDLDAFLKTLYAYFYERGFSCVLVHRFLKIIRCIFVIVFTSFLLLWIDYEGLYNCKDESNCGNLLRFHPLRDLGPWRKVALLVEFTFALYLVVVCHQFLTSIFNSIMMRNLFQEMGVDNNMMGTIQWDNIADRLVRFQTRRSLSRLGAMDHLEFVMRIMRIENYLIAVFDMDVLKLPFLTRSMEWNLRYLFNYMAKQMEHYTVQPPEITIRTLQSKVRWLGLMNLIAAPFIFCYLGIETIFTHGAEMRMQPSKLGMRQWSRKSLWMLREYNELPHVFENRMQEAFPLAQKYIDQFPKRMLSTVAGFIVFVAGGFAATIILMSIFNDALLLHVKVWGQNLLWWLSILTVMIVTGLSLSDRDHHGEYDAEGAMQKLSEYTRYYPDRWKKREERAETQREFTLMYQTRWGIFFHELMSIITTPYHLMFTMRWEMDSLVRFMIEYTVEPESMEGIGPVCAFSTFNLRDFADSARNASESNRKLGKMERSFESFQLIHPNWNVNEIEISNTEDDEKEDARL